MTKQPELKPCPFCGGEAKIGSLGGDQENWAIWCSECGTPCVETGRQGDTKMGIIKVWNTRAKIEVTDEMVSNAKNHVRRVYNMYGDSVEISTTNPEYRTSAKLDLFIKETLKAALGVE